MKNILIIDNDEAFCAYTTHVLQTDDRADVDINIAALVYTSNEDVVYHLEEVQHIIGLNKDTIDTFMLCDSVFESFAE